MAKYLVAVSDKRHSDYEIERRILAEADAELQICDCVTARDIIEQCKDADGILLDMAPMNAEAVAGLTKCKVVNRYGVGYDNVDVAACTAKGIAVTYVPDYCAQDVSDHALALMLSCLRHIPLRDRLVRQGKWNVQQTSFRLQGKVLGILGFGRIARALAKKCSGFGFERIMVYDPYVSEDDCKTAGVVKASLEDVLSSADFISLHMPVTEQTRGMINKNTIALMKPTAILVNTGRGPLICDEDLVEALKKDAILAAGLDTHCHEPLPAGCPYFGLDNVVLTDHTAYSTLEGVTELKTKSAKNIVSVLHGEVPAYQVNK